jgi:hypothetical protein
VVFQPLMSWAEHLPAKRRRCTLGLDTPYYNGHTSVADLLWAGVPVLTVVEPDAGIAGRAAASIIRAAGAPAAFVARSLAEYEDTAAAVYGAWAAAAAGGGSWDAPLLWRPGPGAPLFAVGEFVAGFERLLRAAHDAGPVAGRPGGGDSAAAATAEKYEL